MVKGEAEAAADLMRRLVIEAPQRLRSD